MTFRLNRVRNAPTPAAQLITLEAMEREPLRKRLRALTITSHLLASELGITRPTLYAKIKKHAISGFARGESVSEPCGRMGREQGVKGFYSVCT